MLAIFGGGNVKYLGNGLPPDIFAKGNGENPEKKPTKKSIIKTVWVSLWA